MANRKLTPARLGALLALLAGLSAACNLSPPPGQPALAALTRSAPASTATPAALSATQTATPALTIAPVSSRTPSPLPPTPAFQVCSPLGGLSLADLPGAVVNPYHPPPLGSDDPHQGVDLAQIKNGIAVSGMPEHTVLEGRVALAVDDRFPYGNALLVETPLDFLPPAWLEQLGLPAIPATPEKLSALTCPTPQANRAWDFEQRSLYLLYAHMLEPPALSPGDPVTCGQLIGAIGGSGNALNPHLHLEVRLGPSGARFPGMAHYETRARPEEMWSYCQWRVSGGFLPIDPLLLFEQRVISSPFSP